MSLVAFAVHQNDVPVVVIIPVPVKMYVGDAFCMDIPWAAGQPCLTLWCDSRSDSHLLGWGRSSCRLSRQAEQD
jgi:hypothetical protein